ncbi:MAG: DUF3500 domain-containing protein [Pirellulales bacterium]
MARQPSPANSTNRAEGLDRRRFLSVAGAGAAVAAGSQLGFVRLVSGAPDGREATAESWVRELYATLNPQQRAKVCFAWDHQEADGKPLRTKVSNNWQITDPTIHSDFYTKPQQDLVRKIFEAIIQPDWHGRIDKQLQDDAGGWGLQQSLAIFGDPAGPQFEFVMTGRHMTLRCDGNTTPHVAFGGPIFYGHAAEDFNEKPDHPGNVFWPQALAANSVFEMLDQNQRAQALVAKTPAEAEVGFRGAKVQLPGIAVKDLSSDQQTHVQQVLQKLIEPYRQSDREEVLQCLKVQGGLEGCHMVFYQEDDLGNDKIWDNWRLEGPSFVWHFRGAPHVHVWVNIADSPDVPLNAVG